MWSSIQKKVSLSGSVSNREQLNDDKSDMETCNKVADDYTDRNKLSNEEDKLQGKEKHITEEDNDIHIFDHSPNLFDEISISTKDSLCHGTIIESVHDLQEETNAIFDSNSGNNNNDSFLHNHYEDFKDHSSKNDEIQTMTSIISQGKNISRDHSKSDDGDEKEVDQLSFDQEEAISLDSLQRIEKKAALRSKVEVHRQNLSSKLSLLQTKSSEELIEVPKEGETIEPSGELTEEPAEEPTQLLTKEPTNELTDIPAEKKLSLVNEEEDTNRGNDTAVVREGVYLDLGNLMIKKEDSRSTIDSQLPNQEINDNKNYSTQSNVHQRDHQSAVRRQSLLSKLLPSKTIFHLIVIFSFGFNIVNIFKLIQDNNDVEDSNKQELISDTISLLLLHLKLNKVHDEVLRFHSSKSNHPYKYGLLLINILTLMITLSVVLWSMKSKLYEVNLLEKVKEDDHEISFTSPPVKKFQRELSSLDKKNIFPSTVNTQLVKKDGTLIEVKRTMRFSPEVKRYSPAVRKSKNSKKLVQAHHLKTQKKRADMFSPPLKMKTIPESKRKIDFHRG